MKVLQDLYNSNIDKKWKVPSNSTKGKFYVVTRKKDGEMSCDCIAGSMGGICRHQRRIINQAKGLKWNEQSMK